MPTMDLLHSLTLGDVLREHRRSHPGRTAVVDGDRRLTFPQLDDRVNQLATALSTAGIGPGDRLLWLGQNSFRLLEALLGAAKAGAALCPANWRQSGREMATSVDDLRPALVIWQEEEIGDAVREARGLTTHECRWLRHDAPDGDDEGYEAFLAPHATDDPDLEVDPASPVLLMSPRRSPAHPTPPCSATPRSWYRTS
ncbi:MAG: AMP-binding protein [Acidimicrobiia bacterium]|nr:AMP-binding protein [Acidimicrobiia bacterium]